MLCLASQEKKSISVILEAHTNQGSSEVLRSSIKKLERVLWSFSPLWPHGLTPTWAFIPLWGLPTPLPQGDTRDQSVIPHFSLITSLLPISQPHAISFCISIPLLTPFPKSNLPLYAGYLVKVSPMDLDFWETKARKRIALETMSLGGSPSLGYSSTSMNLHRGPETQNQAALASSSVIAVIMCMAYALCTRYCFRCFVLSIHSHSYQCDMSSCYRRVNWDTERRKNLPRLTQLTRGKAKAFNSRCSSSTVYSLNHWPIATTAHTSLDDWADFTESILLINVI